MPKQHEIQARQQQVLIVGAILRVADLTCLELFIRGWNSLLTFPSSVFLAQREKQRALISFKEFFRAGMLSNFSEERVHPLHTFLPVCPGKKKSQ